METERVTWQTSPNLTNFLLPALYQGLPANHIDMIESLYGPRYLLDVAAQDVAFESIPEELRCTPAFVIARAHSLTSQWRFKDAYHFIRGRLDSGDTEGWGNWEKLILRIKLAYAAVVFQGSFQLARECLNELRQPFLNATFEGIDSIQLFCLCQYLQLVYEVSSSAPSFDQSFYLDVFQSRQGGLQRLMQLRQYLLSTKRLREAMWLFDAEDCFNKDPTAQAAMHQSLISQSEMVKYTYPTQTALAHETIGLCIMNDELNRTVEAEAALRKADRLYRDENGYLHPIFAITLEFFKLRILAEDHDTIDSDALIKLSNKAAELRFYKMECTILRALSIFLLNTSPPKERNSFYRFLRTRLESRLEELGHIKQLASIGTSFYSPLVQTDGDRFLSWWMNFDKNYPDFEDWQIRKERKLQLLHYHDHHDEEDKALEHKTAAESVIEDCILFWERGKASQSQAGTGSRVASEPELRSVRLKSQPVEIFSFEDFLRTDFTIRSSGLLYHGTLGKDKLGRDQAMARALLSWMIHDLTTGELLPLHIQTIFRLNACDTPFTTVQHCRRFLEGITPVELITRLHRYGADLVSCEQWALTFAVFEAWLFRTSNFPEAKQLYMLLQMQNTRCDQPLSFPERLEESRRGLQLLSRLEFSEDIQSQMTPYKSKFVFSIATAYTAIWIRAVEWTESMEKDFQEVSAMLREVIQKPEAAPKRPWLNFFPKTDELSRMSLYYALGSLQLSKIESGGAINIAQTLTYFELAELYFRSSAFPEKSDLCFRVIIKYLKSLESPLVNNIFPKAIRLQLLNAPALRAKQIWYWIQAAKCRGLDALGRGYHLDQQFTSVFLYNHERERRFGPTQLQTIEHFAGTRVVFVDWYTNIHQGEVGPPLMMICKSDEDPKILKLDPNIDLLDLCEYKGKFKTAIERGPNYIGSEDLQPEFWLQKFIGLVEPLLSISNPGDVLVLSPCGPLNGLPLHAISVNGKPLILRNPIVYTNSIRGLYYSLLTRLEAEAIQRDDAVLRSGVFGDIPGTGTTSIEAFAQVLESVPHTGQGFRKEAFTNALRSNPAVIHYHSHATDPPDDPFEQALEFNDSPLTVGEILNLAPAQSFHATILGCGTGAMIKSSASNEQLGLVPALTYAGASSVVSALWKIDNSDAVLFADSFYAAFRRSNAGSPARTIDLARATQQAVLRILESDDDRKSVYHWGGFVLTGWWMLKVPAKRESADDPDKDDPNREEFPVIYAAQPWPPPPPPPAVGIAKWLYMVPRWFSFYTLWPWFE